MRVAKWFVLAAVVGVYVAMLGGGVYAVTGAIYDDDVQVHYGTGSDLVLEFDSTDTALELGDGTNTFLSVEDGGTTGTVEVTGTLAVSSTITSSDGTTGTLSGGAADASRGTLNLYGNATTGCGTINLWNGGGVDTATERWILYGESDGDFALRAAGGTSSTENIITIDQSTHALTFNKAVSFDVAPSLNIAWDDVTNVEDVSGASDNEVPTWDSGTSTIVWEARLSTVAWDDVTNVEDVSGATDGQVPKWNSGTSTIVWSDDAGASAINFTAAGDSGGGQTITDGNTLTVAGGVGATTVDSATDTVTVNVEFGDDEGLTFGADDDFTFDFDSSSGQVHLADTSGTRYQWTSTGTFVASTAITATGADSTIGSLNAGQSDSTRGYLNLYGDASTGAGVVNIYNGGAADTEIERWVLYGLTDGDFAVRAIGGTGTTENVLTVDSATNDVSVTNDLTVGGDLTVTGSFVVPMELADDEYLTAGTDDDYQIGFDSATSRLLVTDGTNTLAQFEDLGTTGRIWTPNLAGPTTLLVTSTSSYDLTLQAAGGADMLAKVGDDFQIIDSATDTATFIVDAPTGGLTLDGQIVAGSGAETITTATGELELDALETAGASSGDLLRYDGSTYAPATLPQKVITLSPSSTAPTTTGGCGAPTQRETTTNAINYFVMPFDGTAASEKAQWTITIPKDCDVTAGFDLVLRWGAESGSGATYWEVSGLALSDDDAFDQALTDTATITDTLTATGDLCDGTASGFMPTSAAAGDLAIVQIQRVYDNVADTLEADADFVRLELWYTVLTTDS